MNNYSKPFTIKLSRDWLYDLIYPASLKAGVLHEGQKLESLDLDILISIVKSDKDDIIYELQPLTEKAKKIINEFTKKR